jgi:pimeloyl-ACP methyl ester carboxylesterase
VFADYDEFGLLADNAADAGIPPPLSTVVHRESVHVADDGQQVSALVWGSGEPSLVLLHGGAQNAHTWDTVALALQRPLIAIDLPGHGHSDWRPDRDYWPVRNAEAVATVVRRLAPAAEAVVGMSLGGLTAISLAANHPDIVRRLVVVDVTPGVDRAKSAPITEFVDGPESFGSFDELLERTVRHNPTRSESSLRRGLLHNARPLEDGRWVWRYDRLRPVDGELDFAQLWPVLSEVRVPMMLVVGGESRVVSEEDIAEFRTRQRGTRLERVAGAGHSVQGDRPIELAELIEDFVSQHPPRE